MDRGNNNQGNSKISTEMLFNILPIIVVIFILIYLKKPEEILSSPEWSLMAAIITGQLIVKFIVYTSNEINKLADCRRNRTSTYYFDPTGMDVWIAGLICLLLVPTLIVLTLSFINQKSPILWVSITQMVLFGISTILYMVLGSKLES